MAQVSMNIEDCRAAPPAVVIAAVRDEAERLGVEAGDGRAGGPDPGDALRGGTQPGSALGIQGFRPGQVLDLPRPGWPGASA